MNTSLIFSLRDVTDKQLVESIDVLTSSSFQLFELSGSQFESDIYSRLRNALFAADKKVFSIQNLVPVNLTRNWISSKESIQSELTSLFTQKISAMERDGIKLAELDVAIDAIRQGNEINDLKQLSTLLLGVLESAASSGVRMALPLRVPKVFPKSLDWHHLTILMNDVLHENLKVVVNLFPFEFNPGEIRGLLKQVFYMPTVIRFCFDPGADGLLTRDALKEWLQVLCDQGFSGELILAPRINGQSNFEEIVKSTSGLLLPYDFDQ